MNIFENAKFGDKFLTSDGRIAVYFTQPYGSEFSNSHRLVVQGEFQYFCFKDDGKNRYNPMGIDIVSRLDETHCHNVNDIIDRECQLKRALEYDWSKFTDDFLNRPYVSEFLKMHNVRILNFDYLKMKFDDCAWTVDIYVCWKDCHEKELVCRLDPKELDRFMTDDTYMVNLLKEKAIEEERLEAEKEEKKKAEKYKLYMQLKEEFEK